MSRGSVLSTTVEISSHKANRTRLPEFKQKNSHSNSKERNSWVLVGKFPSCPCKIKTRNKNKKRSTPGMGMGWHHGMWLTYMQEPEDLKTTGELVSIPNPVDSPLLHERTVRAFLDGERGND